MVSRLFARSRGVTTIVVMEGTGTPGPRASRTMDQGRAVRRPHRDAVAPYLEDGARIGTYSSVRGFLFVVGRVIGWTPYLAGRALSSTRTHDDARAGRRPARRRKRSPGRAAKADAKIPDDR